MIPFSLSSLSPDPIPFLISCLAQIRHYTTILKLGSLRERENATLVLWGLGYLT